MTSHKKGVRYNRFLYWTVYLSAKYYCDFAVKLNLNSTTIFVNVDLTIDYELTLSNGLNVVKFCGF